MKLRYVVARLIPDLLREEPINVGIILQSDDLVACRFVQKIPKDWELPSALEADIAPKLDAVWKARLNEASEFVYISERGTQVEVSHTDRTFLEWLRSTYTRHLQLSDIREADIEVKDAFDFDTFLQRLYNLFVAPRPRPRKPPTKGKLHSAVRRELWSLKLPTAREIRERDVIVGTLPWPIDFVYSIPQNGHEASEVGIGLIDLTSLNFVAKAKDLFATWADVRAVRKDVKTISVIGGIGGLEEHQRVVTMVQRVSDQMFTFERQRGQFLDHVANDFAPLGTFTSEEMQRALRQVSRRLPSPS